MDGYYFSITANLVTVDLMTLFGNDLDFMIAPLGRPSFMGLGWILYLTSLGLNMLGHMTVFGYHTNQ